jgi:hypothetical protein
MWPVVATGEVISISAGRARVGSLMGRLCSESMW